MLVFLIVLVVSHIDWFLGCTKMVHFEQATHILLGRFEILVELDGATVHLASAIMVFFQFSQHASQIKRFR